MKRTLLILSLLLCSLVCGAQEQNAHLVFKGIPVDGHYEDFAQKLVEKGFVQQYIGDDGIIVEGTFMAESSIQVFIYPDPASKVTVGVVAMVPAGNKWPSIEAKYRQIVDLYKEKYGEPAETEEKFTDFDVDDTYKIHCIRNDNCHYSHTWFVEGGRIMVAIEYYRGGIYISCGYRDNQNAAARRKAIIDDI